MFAEYVCILALNSLQAIVNTDIRVVEHDKSRKWVAES